MPDTLEATRVRTHRVGAISSVVKQQSCPSTSEVCCALSAVEHCRCIWWQQFCFCTARPKHHRVRSAGELAVLCCAYVHLTSWCDTTIARTHVRTSAHVPLEYVRLEWTVLEYPHDNRPAGLPKHVSQVKLITTATSTRKTPQKTAATDERGKERDVTARVLVSSVVLQQFRQFHLQYS